MLQVDVGFILSYGNTNTLIVNLHVRITFKNGICDWLSETFRKYMNLEIPIVWNEWAEKICDMGCIVTLIKLDDWDAIDNWSLLYVNKTVCEKTEDYDTTYYNTPIPIGSFPSISFWFIQHEEKANWSENKDVTE